MDLRLSSAERRAMESILRNQSGEARLWRRARMVLLAASGESIASIARQLGTSRARVTEWLVRVREERLDGLMDLPRSGRPRVLTALERHQVVAAACQSPRSFGINRDIWTRQTLAMAVVESGVALHGRWQRRGVLVARSLAAGARPMAVMIRGA